MNQMRTAICICAVMVLSATFVGCKSSKNGGSDILSTPITAGSAENVTTAVQTTVTVTAPVQNARTSAHTTASALTAPVTKRSLGTTVSATTVKTAALAHNHTFGEWENIGTVEPSAPLKQRRACSYEGCTEEETRTVTFEAFRKERIEAIFDRINANRKELGRPALIYREDLQSELDARAYDYAVTYVRGEERPPTRPNGSVWNAGIDGVYVSTCRYSKWTLGIDTWMLATAEALDGMGDPTVAICYREITVGYVYYNGSWFSAMLFIEE